MSTKGLQVKIIIVKKKKKSNITNEFLKKCVPEPQSKHKTKAVQQRIDDSSSSDPLPSQATDSGHEKFINWGKKKSQWYELFIYNT